MKQPDLHTAKRFLRPIAFGVLSGAVACLLLLLLTAVVMGLWDIPLGAVALIATCAFALGGFLAGYVGSRLAGEKGLLLGLVSGVLLFLILVVASLFGDCEGFGMQGFTRLVSVLLAAAIGGILGVNRRKKFKC